MTTIGMKAPLKWALLATGAVLALTACTSTSGGPATSSPAAQSTAPTVQSPTPTTTGQPSGAPPTASSAVGAIVEGFPADLLPLMPGATLVSTSFDKSAVPATVGLVGSVPEPPSAVVGFYTAAIEGQGFTAVPGESTGSVASKVFVRVVGGTNETITLGVVEVGGTSTFTLGADVSLESIK